MRDSALRPLLSAGLLAGLLCACDAPAETTPPNLVVVTIDTLRADHVGCYGYFRDTTPALDELAEESLLFERCHAPVAQTLPTHASLFTGLQPLEHGLEANFTEVAQAYILPDAVSTLADVLSRQGYRTAGFVSAEPLKRESGMARGFQVWAEPEPKHARAAETIDRALEWLAAEGPGGDDPREPFFLWVHVFDPHLPYEPEPPYDEMFTASPEQETWLEARRFPTERRRQPPENERKRQHYEGRHDRYDGEIRYTDDQLARLLHALRASGAWERTVTVVTSDHGEGLGQHGVNGHEALWVEQVAVPLVVRVPGHPAARIATPISHRDIFPTLFGRVPTLSLADFVDQATGRDVLADGQGPLPLFGQLPGNQPLEGRVLTVGEWRLVSGIHQDPDLYELANDPYELKDVGRRHPEKVAELSGLLERILEEQRETRSRVGAGDRAPVSASRKENLEALGYGGGGGDE